MLYGLLGSQSMLPSGCCFGLFYCGICYCYAWYCLLMAGSKATNFDEALRDID